MAAKISMPTKIDMAWDKSNKATKFLCEQAIMYKIEIAAIKPKPSKLIMALNVISMPLH